jgi:hypothetical protein
MRTSTSSSAGWPIDSGRLARLAKNGGLDDATFENSHDFPPHESDSQHVRPALRLMTFQGAAGDRRLPVCCHKILFYATSFTM